MPVGDGATFRFIVEDALSGGGSGGGKGGGGKGGSDNPDPDKPERQVEQVKKLAKAAEGGITRSFKALGIQVTLGNLLKQSQVFTGIVSSIFQVLGAVLDVALAPLLPFLGKFLKDYFPTLLKFSERIANFLSGELAKFEELGLSGYFSYVFDRLGSFIIDLIPNLLSKVASAIGAWFRSTEFSTNLNEFTEKIKTAFTNLGEWIDNWLPGPSAFKKPADSSGDEGGSGGLLGQSEEIPKSKAGTLTVVQGAIRGVADTLTGIKNVFTQKTGPFGKVLGGLTKGVTTFVKDIIPLANTTSGATKGALKFGKKFLGPLGVAFDIKEVADVYQKEGLDRAFQLGLIKTASILGGLTAGAGTAMTGAGAPVAIPVAGGTTIVLEEALRRLTKFDSSLEVTINSGGPSESTTMVTKAKQDAQASALLHNDTSMYTGGY